MITWSLFIFDKDTTEVVCPSLCVKSKGTCLITGAVNLDYLWCQLGFSTVWYYANFLFLFKLPSTNLSIRCLHNYYCGVPMVIFCHHSFIIPSFIDWNYSVRAVSFFFYLFICLFLFFAVRVLSLVVASGGSSSLQCVGFSLKRLLLLRSTGSRHAGSRAQAQ